MTEAPNYFVQTTDGTLFGYWRLDILLCDVSLNKGQYTNILKKNAGFVLSYSPVSIDQLRAEAA